MVEEVLGGGGSVTVLGGVGSAGMGGGGNSPPTSDAAGVGETCGTGRTSVCVAFRKSALHTLSQRWKKGEQTANVGLAAKARGATAESTASDLTGFRAKRHREVSRGWIISGVSKNGSERARERKKERDRQTAASAGE